MQPSALSASAPAHGVFRQARHPAGGRRWSALQRAASALPCAHSCMPRTATPPNGSSQAPGASARLAAHSSACTCHLLGQPAATVLPAWAGGRAQAEEEAGRAPVTHSSSWRPSPASPSARARNCRTRSSARCTTGAGPAASSSRSPWPPRRQAAGRAGDAPTMRNLAFGSLGRAAAVRTPPSSAGRRRESGVQHDAHPCTQRHCPRQRAGPHCQPHPRIRSQNGHALGAGYSPGATQTRSACASQLDAAQRRGRTGSAEQAAIKAACCSGARPSRTGFAASSSPAGPTRACTSPPAPAATASPAAARGGQGGVRLGVINIAGPSRHSLALACTPLAPRRAEARAGRRSSAGQH